MKKSISIIIPALNESKIIEETFITIHSIAKSQFEIFEIILVNDGSIDTTGSIMAKLARKYQNTKFIDFPYNKGLSYIFKFCIQNVQNEYITLFPGDNSYGEEGVRRLFGNIGSGDIILGFRENIVKIFPIKRIILSKMLILAVWPISGLLFKDVHGPFIYPVRILKDLELKANGYSYNIEVLAQLAMMKLSFVQVPVNLNQETIGNSNALSYKTFINMSKTWLRLFIRRFKLRY
jgi:glycosyltransferase involved in cell wall biosynthesis